MRPSRPKLENVMEITDIIKRRGLDKFDRIYNLAQYAINTGCQSHLVFAYDCEGTLEFTASELCEVFQYAKFCSR